VVLSRADPYPVGGSRYRHIPRARFPDQPGLTGPLRIGDYAKIEAGAHLREYTVIGKLPTGSTPGLSVVDSAAAHQ
jgi:hypothetical protein